MTKPTKISTAQSIELLADALDELHTPWYLFGAQAVILYGIPRATFDIDVTLDAQHLDAAAVVKHLQTRGFKLRVTQDVKAFIAASRVIPLRQQKSGMEVDLVLGGPGLEEEIARNCNLMRIEKRRVPVIAVNDLLVLKCLAGRPKDLDDVVQLLRIKPEKLNLKTVRTQLQRLGAMVDDSSLVDRFERALKQSRAKSVR